MRLPVRVASQGGKLVTVDQHGGISISVDDERLVPEDVKEVIGC
jgi:hypothetical protein